MIYQNPREAFAQHFNSMPNSVRTFRGLVRKTIFGIPVRYKTITDVGWGQYAHDEDATRMVAYYLWNHNMRSGWEFVSWTAEMSDGASRRGKGLKFKFSDYGLVD